MPAPVRTFSASSLPAEVQKDAKGRKRKPAPGAPAEIDLRGCELLSMSQFECDVEKPEDSQSPVKCMEVLKFFRRCADRKGPFMVETTLWENQARDKSLADES